MEKYFIPMSIKNIYVYFRNSKMDNPIYKKTILTFWKPAETLFVGNSRSFLYSKANSKYYIKKGRVKMYTINFSHALYYLDEEKGRRESVTDNRHRMFYNVFIEMFYIIIGQ
uniref:Uncharacterized protein n=1 Tax=Glossina palpalis gambiensis TaxID=67801 RepID=A0A1B0BW65_9MUSC